MKELIKIFKALSEPMRLRIIKLLEKKKACVCEITEVLKITQPAISHHLNILKEAGLIEYDKQGKWINYKLTKEKDNPHIKKLIKLISEMLKEDPIIIDDGEKIQKADRYLISQKLKRKR